MGNNFFLLFVVSVDMGFQRLTFRKQMGKKKKKLRWMCVLQHENSNKIFIVIIRWRDFLEVYNKMLNSRYSVHSIIKTSISKIISKFYLH